MAMTDVTSRGRDLAAPDRHSHCDGCAVVIERGRVEWAHMLGCPNDREGKAA